MRDAQPIQDLADYVGDSLGLSFKAKETDAEVIAFCGVHFMAETAKILNPGKTVVLPDKDAGCSLEQSCPAEQLEAFLEEHRDRDYYGIAYINCSAEVKAMSDLICTSSNAVAMAQEFKDDELILAPDRHLARWIAKELGRDDLIVWPGSCIVHEQFSAKELAKMTVRYPEAEVLAHPECEAAVLDQAHFIGSTAKIIKRSVESPADTLIIATEDGVFHTIEQELTKAGKSKVILQAPGMDESCACNRCPFMRLNTLEKLYLCLRDLTNEVTVPENVRVKALVPIERMLELSA